MALLTKWFKANERINYQGGAPVSFLKHDKLTPEMLENFAVFGRKRFGEVLSRYEGLKIQVESDATYCGRASCICSELQRG